MKKERVFWGVLFILGAIALIVSKLGYFDDINVFSILLTIGLVGISIKSLFTRSFSGVLFPIAFICIIYSEQLGITEITPGVVLIAALLGSIGLSMIFSKRSNRSYNKSKWESYEYDTIDLEDESYIKLDTSFAGSIKYVNTENFKQADLKCSFGSMKVYFDNAILYKGNGVVRLDASFSGIELYIPKIWSINDKTNIAFGSLDEKNRNEPIEANTLTLVGNISFSGVEIIYI
ncbi:MAG: hypothetical protein RSD13_06225 [Clostridium sp.]